MNKSHLKTKHLIALLVLFIAILPSDVFAQGNLLVTPRRIVFDGSRRVYDINLANIGNDTARYNISMIQYRMREDGSFEEITEPDPGQNFADKNIRFFPRSVTLAPNEAQVVKMQVANINRLQPGEYRSHAYFRSVPNVVALGSEQTETDTTGLSVRLTPIFGISIPVIIRVGESTTEASITNLEFEKTAEGANRLHFVINRSGNMSVYGDIRIVHTSPQGRETVVSAINGIAVYTPNALRNVTVDLISDTPVNYNSGKISISFYSQSDVRPVTYAEAELTLP